MAEVGIEPTRPIGQGILNPQRLPFRHSAFTNLPYNRCIIGKQTISASYYWPEWKKFGERVETLLKWVRLRPKAIFTGSGGGKLGSFWSADGLKAHFRGLGGGKMGSFCIFYILKVRDFLVFGEILRFLPV